jgi:type II secretory pathway component PulK
MTTRRGVTLVLVLGIIVILGTVGARVARASRASTALAANLRARAVGRAAAESGIALAVSRIESTLGSLVDSASRRVYLTGLEATRGDSIVLGDGRAAVALLDPGARLDVNNAPPANLAQLFAQVADAGRARETAMAIRRWIERDNAGGPRGDASPRFVTPARSLEELRDVPGVDPEVLERAAPLLTVDGDGTITGPSAPPAVRQAAFGEVRLEPSRVVVIVRGWLAGHPLTHEVQAVYAISGTSLVLVHWRERDL